MLRPRAGGQPSDPHVNARCQKCLKTGHWTFDCTGERVYRSRPTRTALLANPALQLPEARMNTRSEPNLPLLQTLSPFAIINNPETSQIHSTLLGNESESEPPYNSSEASTEFDDSDNSSINEESSISDEEQDSDENGSNQINSSRHLTDSQFPSDDDDLDEFSSDFDSNEDDNPSKRGRMDPNGSSIVEDVSNLESRHLRRRIIVQSNNHDSIALGALTPSR